jgi:putative membrane protein
VAWNNLGDQIITTTKERQMHMDGWHMAGGWMWLAWLAVILVMALLVLAIARAIGRAGGTSAGTRSAEDTLRERFARGEIDQDEYRERLDALRRG